MKKITLLIVFALSLNATSLKNKVYGNATVEKVKSIYDGDTFRADIQDYPPIVGERMAIRILGIDTPEMRGKCRKEKLLAREAKQMTVSLLRSAKVIELRNIKRGKYFRILADVYVDGNSVGLSLLRDGLAVKYDGGTKIDWCK